MSHDNQSNLIPFSAGIVVLPIDRGPSNPPISIGGDEHNNSGTGIYGTYTSLSISVSGSVVASYGPGGVVFQNNVANISGSGAPVNGVTGANLAGPGSFYIRVSGALSDAFINVNTMASPTWKLITRAA